MKALLVLGACCVLGALAANQSAREVARKAKRECMQEAGLTEDDVKKMKDQDQLATPASKKMMACVFTRNKIMRGNKFSKEGSMAVATAMMQDSPQRETKLKIAQQIADNCAAEIGNVEATGEEMANLIFSCLKKQAKETVAVSAKRQENVEQGYTSPTV